MSHQRFAIDRRGLLTGIGGAALAAGVSAGPALARAPLATAQAPGVYRHRVGSIEVTALLDGNLAFPNQALPNLFARYDASVATRLREASFGPAEGVPLAVNAFLVNTGDKLVMVDAGAAKALGPNLGQIPANLQAAGVAPGDVDIIVVTHLHRDHCAGLLTEGGQAVFPNAELQIAEADVAYWTDTAAEAAAPAPLRAFFPVARQVMTAYGNRVKRIPLESEVAPGVRTLPIPGHTPGHIGVHVSSGNQQLLMWSDVVHAQSLQFARPDWSISFDSDPDLAARTRVRIFDQVATDRIVVAGSHLAFPGLGHVEKRSEGYGFAPLMWRSPL